ncbi:AraC family transcriptional regulator [uncultured Shewanella sp.]|uniref:helix-turn-helix transcriptional regulator n=1 Tax=uncultured Shewanella sp. TaxID=173975 RepID=UPI0026228A81|nr:AraC family transcriptional regulator [uncultured Shewanella sp.]
MQQDYIHYWQHPSIAEMAVSRARFQHFTFEKHVHLDYHVGLISQGSQRYSHKGQQYHVGNTVLSTLNPDEVHDGTSHQEEGYTANVMSIPIHYFHHITQELKHTSCYFQHAILPCSQLCQAFLQLHHLLTQQDKNNIDSQLIKETTTMAFTTELILRHCKGSLADPKHSFSLSHQQLKNIKSLFHSQLTHAFKLEELATQTGLSQFQFLRQFKKATGITPHAYLKCLRLEYAKKALLKGDKSTSIAHNMGFFDQSHFNKTFKAAYLMTPSHFQRQITA